MNHMMDQNSFPLSFSGHETFPLRQMWLKKVVDIADQNGEILKRSFSDPEQIALLGVGKNMLSSMKYWALVCGVISEKTTSSFVLTDLAEQIFSDEGYDPYSEYTTTAWLMHWNLAKFGTKATTIYWVFNKINSPSLSKTELVTQLKQLCDKRQKKVSDSSFSKDIDASLRGYVTKSNNAHEEDCADPFFNELGLLSYNEGNNYAFNRGPKVSLNVAAFLYALLDYWESQKEMSKTLSFDEVAYGDSSPGRVFKLDEDSIVEYMSVAGELTANKLTWSNTAGIKQLSKTEDGFTDLKNEMLRKAYD